MSTPYNIITLIYFNVNVMVFFFRRKIEDFTTQNQNQNQKQNKMTKKK